MNENFFSIKSKNQNVAVQPNDIDGSYDGYMSYLRFFINFRFSPPNPRSEFDVLSITARLLIPGEIIISKVIIHTSISIRSDYSMAKCFKFELDERALECIERKRNGDIQFRVELDFQILMKTLEGIDASIRSAEGILIEQTHLQPIVPKSIWAEKILKQLGYKSFTLIEVPLHHNLLEEGYDGILAEFKEAEQYFLKQDYNKAIAHCRSTMDALTRNLSKIKKNEPSETKFKWLESTSETTLAYINGLNKANAAISSKTHHSVSSNRNFSRVDAESIYLVTLSLLHFINNVKEQHNN